jgi:hypothetical protein
MKQSSRWEDKNSSTSKDPYFTFMHKGLGHFNTLARLADRAKVLVSQTSTCSNGINTQNHTKPMAVRCSCAPDDGCK